MGIDANRAAAAGSGAERRGHQPKKSFGDWDREAQDIFYRRRDDEAGFDRYSQHPDTAAAKDKEKAMQYLDKTFAVIESLAKAFGGKAERLGVYPEELAAAIPDGRHPYLDPKRYHNGFGEEMAPFARMTIGDRDYMFTLLSLGSVNVYRDGRYVGGNHDLALFEIFDHLQRDSMFGVNSG